MNADLIIEAWPKGTSNDVTPYDDINPELHSLKFHLLDDEGLIIYGEKENNERIPIAEFDEKQALQIAKTIIHYYEMNPIKAPYNK